jgi:heat shock transcription factor, other eukaryote
VSFLRGQTCLLARIIHRSHDGKRKDDGYTGNDVTEGVVAMEVLRLRQEQRAIEEQVTAMWRRVQETERRPKKMLMFLIKVAGEPQVLHASSPGPAATPTTLGS